MSPLDDPSLLWDAELEAASAVNIPPLSLFLPSLMHAQDGGFWKIQFVALHKLPLSGLGLTPNGVDKKSTFN